MIFALINVVLSEHSLKYTKRSIDMTIAQRFIAIVATKSNIAHTLLVLDSCRETQDSFHECAKSTRRINCMSTKMPAPIKAIHPNPMYAFEGMKKVIIMDPTIAKTLKNHQPS